RADARLSTLRPDCAALTQYIGGSGTAVTAHPTECDNAATATVLLRQIKHHLIDRGAVRFGPTPPGQQHDPVFIKTHFLADRHHHNLTAANPVILTAPHHVPFAVSPYDL